ncbi:hypothetical protein [Deinococcus cellulosilyticus]|uniref:Uncharacterized protein n=1 Tax=Deinococcus cellulosilyticus (strain DSM 18568 / NBRC 106333 / KACC 11606 / 5516J-15) TaxID=1223518 RepID=A0A511NBL4_DEIC1|nr:hypothetical protein [Deinococcus cellulosilyticus]GEM49987.1 hypothetical protein DC3_56220 [Deinococcus cellulosilyticus NBRC 106333 = KACC 11606]
MDLSDHILKRQAERLLLLEYIYQQVEVKGEKAVETWTFMEKHAMAAPDLIRAVEYLKGENLIRKMGDRGEGFMLVTLSHLGVVEIEAAHRRPKEGTLHFSPQVVNHFYGEVKMQQGNQNTLLVDERPRGNEDE